ncbi:hypothetical protein SPBR_00971 [Sporothrix brasiliensis 5110]|uniref:G-patch domain-containing protein n=1 Tax=Sporothrix brasiliensis 5110 TaxID=1398154 RepID=A0A0C2IZ97_9PEZI|nr:uncharacterized protein SPBR_00971 [Sporothrix brasiliensis 5110]KIH90307.1 hypothetical protein SPBR_00971 [Sporothrix brasiliensis 5110]
MAHRRQSTTDRNGGLNEDGASDTPLHRLPGFGTGLHRQRVAFVRAGEAPQTKGSGPTGALPGGAVSDLYLSIVIGQTEKREGSAESVAKADEASTTAPTTPACDVCRLPLTTPSSAAAHHHESCLVHQVALDHSKPPSSLNRGRLGLAIMSAQGWDPDSGRGLGADQQGMPYPIEAKLRPERQALGNGPAPSSSESRSRSSGSAASAPTRNRKHTRKQLRAMEEDRRRRYDRLREQIMGNKDLDKYLRPQEGE